MKQKQDCAALVSRLRGPLQEVMCRKGGLGETSLMCPPNDVADDVMKIVVRGSNGRPAAVLRISPPFAPHAVRRELERAEQAKRALGSELGQVVLEPLLTGDLDGRSFALLPYHTPVSTARLGWAVQRQWLRPLVLRWLRAATAATQRQPSEDQIQGDFHAPLEFMESNPALSACVREEAGKALRLIRGGWQPKYVLAHNDLWHGNVLLWQGGFQRGLLSRSPCGFCLIDWGAALLKGHALYDLVHWALYTGLTRRRLMVELHLHCRILDCGLEGAKAYLLAGLGHLGTHLEQFPVDCYLACVESHCRLLFDLDVKSARGESY